MGYCRGHREYTASDESDLMKHIQIVHKAVKVNQTRFKVEHADIEVPEGVEAIWAVLTPGADTSSSKVKRIAVGSIYVSPNFKYRVATIDHIIEIIHLLRAKYHNEIHFLCGGDVNRH